jgi:hypothetical protein
MSRVARRDDGWYNELGASVRLAQMAERAETTGISARLEVRVLHRADCAYPFLIRVRRVAIALSLLPSLALAQQPTPKAVLIPMDLLARLEQLLSDPAEARQIPLYEADFAPLIKAIDDCAKIQTPNNQGIVVSHGECPEVQQAIAERTRAAATATPPTPPTPPATPPTPATPATPPAPPPAAH